jgi:DNA replication and repair protein RecF
MIADIYLQNFRSYKDQSFEFESGVNIIVGPNASGKTNLLESILVVARGKSYKVKDKDLVNFSSEWARLDATLDDSSLRTIKFNSNILPNKVYEIGAKKYKRLSLGATLPVVLFEPNHLQLLSGSPERRREYIDDILEQTRPGFGTIRNQYKRVLFQRNALLKQHGTSLDQFFPWNIRLSELAGKIVKARIELIEYLNNDIEKSYQEISKTKSVTKLVYGNEWAESYETKLLIELESKLEQDKLRGHTSSGPHRDDILSILDSHDVNESASRGEIRTIVLALKIAELKLHENLNPDKKPILLLDDVFSELDGSRRHALTKYLDKYQTFITTTDADLVVENFVQSCNVIALD